MSDGQQFCMVRAEFDEASLFRFAAHFGMPLGFVDTGYMVHGVLRALFGDAAPAPFGVTAARSRRLVMLGYGPADHRELAERARAAADPLALAVLDLASLCSKPMPVEWRAGALWRFEASICPVVRISGRSTGEASREVDAFLHRCWREGPQVKVDRATVYRDWLGNELNRDGAARVVDARMVRFRRERLFRRDRSGAVSRSARCERPSVTMAGTLEVTAPQAFAALLRRGLGRHRAFGFGMLLLRP